MWRATNTRSPGGFNAEFWQVSGIGLFLPQDVNMWVFEFQIWTVHQEMEFYVLTVAQLRSNQESRALISPYNLMGPVWAVLEDEIFFCGCFSSIMAAFF